MCCMFFVRDFSSDLKRQAKDTRTESDDQETDPNVSFLDKKRTSIDSSLIRNITRLDCIIFRLSNKRVKSSIHIHILFPYLYEILLINIVI